MVAAAVSWRASLHSYTAAVQLNRARVPARRGPLPGDVAVNMQVAGKSVGTTRSFIAAPATSEAQRANSCCVPL